MPPRSYYNTPRIEDYLAFAKAFFPNEIAPATDFSITTGRPYLQADTHLAAYLGISTNIIRQILHNKKYHYRTFPLLKANGDSRLISTPKTYLKVVQWWICDNIFSTAKLSEATHGFCKGRSYITNAAAHMGTEHLLNVDIAKFFPSISQKMIISVFRELGYGDVGAMLLAQLSSLDGMAPTGAPTSPLIGNLVLRQIDDAIETVIASRGIRYTRYADDLTFSSRQRIEDDFLFEIARIVEEGGFHLNYDKTRFIGKGGRMDVTGVVINEKINLPIDWRNWARGFLKRAVRNPADYIDERDTISGIFGVLKSVDPEEERPLTHAARATLAAIKSLRPQAS